MPRVDRCTCMERRPEHGCIVFSRSPLSQEQERRRNGAFFMVLLVSRMYDSASFLGAAAGYCFGSWLDFNAA